MVLLPGCVCFHRSLWYRLAWANAAQGDHVGLWVLLCVTPECESWALGLLAAAPV